MYDYAKPKYGEKVKFWFVDKVSLYTYKQMLFIKTLCKIFKLDLILQIMNKIDSWVKEKPKN